MSFLTLITGVNDFDFHLIHRFIDEIFILIEWQLSVKLISMLK